MTIRILHVGTGIRGGHWARFVADHPDARSAGFVDADQAALERVREAGASQDAKFLTDLDEALGTVGADAALIASPSDFHAEHAIKALDAGLCVMVEKPLATTVAEAKRVLEKARAVGQQVVVAENYRYWPAERTVRALLKEGRIGAVDHATLIDRRHMPSHTEGPWLAEIEYPQLQEIAIHHFDSLRSFFDARPQAITARAWNPRSSDYAHGACTEALIELDGIQVQYLGTLTSGRFSFSLWIEGEKGVLWTNRKYVFWRRSGSRLFRPVKLVKVPPGDGAPYPKGGTTSLLNSLRDAATRGEPAETSGADNIWNVAMVEAGKISDRESRSVRIDELYEPSSAPD